MGMPMSDRKSRSPELRAGHALVAKPEARDKMGSRGLTFNQEHLKVEEPGRLQGRGSFQQWPGRKVAAPGEWSARGGQQGGRTRPGAPRTGGRGLWTEGLGSNPSLILLPTYHSRCFGVTSSSVALTLLLQAGGRARKTSGQSQPDRSPRDSTSSIPTSLPLNACPFSKF